MVVWSQRFNLYLVLAAALALFCGCQTHKKDQPFGALRVHLQTAPDSAGTSQTITLLRSEPVMVNIAREPFLTEANIAGAKIVDTPGGFAVEIKFDENGTWVLEQYSGSNLGSHFAIFGQWSEKIVDGRWLAAPLITKRITDGLLAFTPDASRAEMDQMVKGLNYDAANNKKGQFKDDWK